MEGRYDPLGPAKGIRNGLLFSIPLWVLLYLLFF